MKRRFMYTPFFIVAGIVLLIFSLSVVNSRRNIEISGTVIKSQKVILDVLNKDKYATKYIIGTDKGKEIIYKAYSNDNSLQRDLNVGTVIYKKKGEIEYTINGEVVQDFPIGFYRTLIIISSSFILFGFIVITLKHIYGNKT